MKYNEGRREAGSSLRRVVPPFVEPSSGVRTSHAARHAQIFQHALLLPLLQPPQCRGCLLPHCRLWGLAVAAMPRRRTLPVQLVQRSSRISPHAVSRGCAAELRLRHTVLSERCRHRRRRRRRHRCRLILRQTPPPKLPTGSCLLRLLRRRSSLLRSPPSPHSPRLPRPSGLARPTPARRRRLSRRRVSWTFRKPPTCVR